MGSNQGQVGSIQGQVGSALGEPWLSHGLAMVKAGIGAGRAMVGFGLGWSMTNRGLWPGLGYKVDFIFRVLARNHWLGKQKPKLGWFGLADSKAPKHG